MNQAGFALACYSLCDPFEVAMDVLGKFSNEFTFVWKVDLVELSPRTYWKKSASFTCTNGQIFINLFWSMLSLLRVYVFRL